MKLSLLIVIVSCSLAIRCQQQPAHSLPGRVAFAGTTIYNAGDSAVKAVLKLLNDYHQASLKDPFLKGDFWASTVTDKIPDYMLKSELNRYRDLEIVASVIYVHRQDSFYIAQVAYHLYRADTLKGTACVYNYGVVREKGKFRLMPYLALQKLSVSKSADITLYSSAGVSVSREALDSLSRHNASLANRFKIPQKHLTLYVFNSFTELNGMVGLDLHVTPNITPDNAYCDVYNGKVLATSVQSLFHEAVHLYTAAYGDNRSHRCFDEGLALLLGGSAGHDATYHLNELKKFVAHRPELNLGDVRAYNDIFINEKTGYLMDVGALICLSIHDRHGFEGIRRLLRYGYSDNAFYEAIQKELQIDSASLNRYLRSELKRRENGYHFN